jgi:hypothetical protein
MGVVAAEADDISIVSWWLVFHPRHEAYPHHRKQTAEWLMPVGCIPCMEANRVFMDLLRLCDI